jgi:hypothetical protein
MPPDERLSMAEQLSANFDKLEAETPDPVVVDEPVADAPVETEEAKAERLRDEAGRFKSDDKPREKLTLKPKEAKDAAPKQERPEERQDPGAKEAAPKVETKAEVIPPPSNWTGKGKIQWERLHHDLKVELSQELSRASETSTKLGPVGTALAPYEQELTQLFGGPDRGVSAILSTWKYAQAQPIAFVKDFCQKYQIDPQALGFAAAHQQVDPAPGAEVNQFGQVPPELQQRLTAVESRLQQEAEQRSIQQQNQITADIQAFGSETDKTSGTLAHPYFNDVRKQMGVMMAGGLATTLQDAYDQACWAVPTIRVELQREAERKAAEQRKQAVAKAQKAGGSITGSPGVARAETHVSQSVRADLLKNWDAQEARV